MTAEASGVRIVRGTPTSEELAALVVVLAARSRQVAPTPRRPSRWADPALQLRTPPHRPWIGR